MTYNRKKQDRKSIRLKGYDYVSPGVYFVTICTKGRKLLFGEIQGSEVVLNQWGRIVQEEWLRSAEIRPEIDLDAFVLMPNHLHGIIWFCKGAPPSEPATHGQKPLRRPPRSLGSFVAGFKSACTTRINRARNSPGTPVWQRNYHEHIIRTEAALARIRHYIRENPARWARDRDHRAKPDRAAGALGAAPHPP